MAPTRLANKTQEGEANPSKFGLQNMILPLKKHWKFVFKILEKIV